MDIRMPLLDGIEATRQITAAGPPPRVLILATFDLDEYLFGALRAGASWRPGTGLSSSYWLTWPAWSRGRRNLPG
jgi:CheY-like chemotaxis protein